jgi:hypothetical protein
LIFTVFLPENAKKLKQFISQKLEQKFPFSHGEGARG